MNELRRASRTWGAAVVGVAAVMCTSGCGHGGEAGVIRSGHSFVLVGPKVTGPVVGVGWGGRVTMSGRCLGINGMTVIWPHGTKVISADPFTVDVPGIGHVAVGDVVSGGGDPGNGRSSPVHLPKGIDELPPGCPSDVAGFSAD